MLAAAMLVVVVWASIWHSRELLIVNVRESDCAVERRELGVFRWSGGGVHHAAARFSVGFVAYECCEPRRPPGAAAAGRSLSR